MSDTTEGPGPALAAHSKDASTPGQNPASAAKGEAKSAGHDGEPLGEAVARLLKQVTDFVRQQPFATIAACIVFGLICGRSHGRK